MLRLVDSVDVEPERADEYLHVVRTLGVPVMTEAGATFVWCGSTSRGLGEDVRIQVEWSCADHAHWNVIRKNLVLDVRWYQYAALAAALRTGGTRRFYGAAGPSPR